MRLVNKKYNKTQHSIITYLILVIYLELFIESNLKKKLRRYLSNSIVKMNTIVLLFYAFILD